MHEARRVSSLYRPPRRQLLIRVGMALLVFSVGFLGFRLGAQVDERTMTNAGVLAHAYYSVGLFVMGGLDLGAPSGGPVGAQVLLWIAYISAPALTVVTLIEAFIRAFAERAYWRLPLNQHIVLAGFGRLGQLYLRVIQELEPERVVVVVDPKVDGNTPTSRTLRFVSGDIRDPAVLDEVSLERSAAVILMTSDDFVNLESAVSITARCPELKHKVVVHLADIELKRLISERVASETEDRAGATLFLQLGSVDVQEQRQSVLTATRDQILNANRITARHLVTRELVPHIRQLDGKSVVILVGFEGFGQSVLEIVRREAHRYVERVVVVDPAAARRMRTFRDQVRPTKKVLPVVEAEGALTDTATWDRVVEQTGGVEGSATTTIVICTSDDGQNIRLGLWLRRRHPEAYLVVRCFRQSVLSERLQETENLHICYEASLLRDSLLERHQRWFQVEG